MKCARIASVLLAVNCLVAVTVANSAAQEPAGQRLQYVSAPLRDVLRSLAATLGINLLLPASLPDVRVTYSSATSLTPAEIGGVLESILESHGLILVSDGASARVIAADKAPRTGAVSTGRELPARSLGLVTHVFPLQAVVPEEAVNLLKTVAAPSARIEVVPRGTAVLITDQSRNVARYLELLREIDVAGQGEAGLRTYVIRLKHANATDLAITIAALFGATLPTELQDRGSGFSDRGLSSELQQFRSRELEALAMRAGIRAGLPVAAVQPAQLRDTLGGLVGSTTVVPDAPTNSLVLRTAPANYPVLLETIRQLDVRPAQVLLEVAVVEVTLDRAFRFGIDWSVFTDDGLFGAGPTRVQLGPQRPDSSLAGLQDFVLRVVSLNDVDITAVLNMLAGHSDVRVLSRPHVLALNNEEARILVGSEVPFNASTRSGLDVVVDRIIQYRNVGTQLTIIPTINEDGYVTFRILQEVSNLTSQTIEAALNAPVITTREAETSALARDGQTIVIGGLIGESSDVIENGVPLLKDIPLLGWLFKSRETSRSRTEIAIFVTPYVVFSDADAQRILEDRRRKLRNVPDAMKRDSIPPSVRPK